MCIKVLGLIWFLHIKLSNTRTFLDEIDVNDYCPDIGECHDNTHVACSYYNDFKNRKYGPACGSNIMKSFVMTDKYADVILEDLNKYRGYLAMGMTVVTNNTRLPRGYGIFKLQWCEELALFAQIWANQCDYSLDLCRASKRFRRPYQALTVRTVRSLKIDPSDFENDLRDMIDQAYHTKVYGPPLHTGLRDKFDKTMDFRAICYSKATHVGCGFIGYNLNPLTPTSYTLLLVCNFAPRPYSGDPLYETVNRWAEKPRKEIEVCPDKAHCTQIKDEIFTSRCGCPPNTVETKSCLCEQPCDRNCEKPVIMLPIFADEDDSTEKVQLKQYSEELFQNSEHTPRLDKYFELGYERETSFSHARKNKRLSNNGAEVRRSIFAAAPKFKLPSSVPKADITKHETRVDIERKDYTSVKQTPNNHMYDKRKQISDIPNEQTVEPKSTEMTEKYDEVVAEYTKESVSSIENGSDQITPSDEATDPNINQSHRLKPESERLMKLLDSLQEHIQNNEIDDRQRGIIIAKIKQIHNRLMSLTQ